MSIYDTLQLSLEDLRTNYEKERAKLEEMRPKQSEPTPQGKKSCFKHETAKTQRDLSSLYDVQWYKCTGNTQTSVVV